MDENICCAEGNDFGEASILETNSRNVSQSIQDPSVNINEEMRLRAKSVLNALGSQPAVHSMEYFELRHVMEVLHAHIDIAGSQRTFSHQIEVTESYVSNILNGVKEPSKKVLDTIGYEAVTLYRKKAILSPFEPEGKG